MLGTAFSAIDRLYPSRRWGAPDDELRLGAGIDEDEAAFLADELASELNACTFYRPGAEDEYCDFIYVLCVGREPCLVQVRDLGVAMPEELFDLSGEGGAGMSEQYLRICLSSMARVAGVQQVAMDLRWQDGMAIIEERPRPGVYDAPLLSRFQRLVATLPAYDIVHLDFGEICEAVPGFDGGDYARLYGGQPVAANYLFFPQPPTTRTTAALSLPSDL